MQYNLKHGLFVTQERPEVYLAATVQCGRCACFIVIAGTLFVKLKFFVAIYHYKRTDKALWRSIQRNIITMTSSFSSTDICSTNFTSKGENHLVEDLFSATRYNKRVRPVRRSEEVVNVTFGLVVREIVDLVRKQQYRTITLYLLLSFWAKKVFNLTYHNSASRQRNQTTYYNFRLFAGW